MKQFIQDSSHLKCDPECDDSSRELQNALHSLWPMQSTCKNTRAWIPPNHIFKETFALLCTCCGECDQSPGAIAKHAIEHGMGIVSEREAARPRCPINLVNEASIRCTTAARRFAIASVAGLHPSIIHVF